MQLHIRLDNPAYADGCYTIKAKKCMMASLHWGNESGILPDWTAFAYVPILPGGTGKFQYLGQRAIPEEATCVFARGVSADFSETDQCMAKLPRQACIPQREKNTRFAVMSDLHITNKPGRLNRVLKQINNIQPDALLLPGDLVNDGRAEQFALLWSCLEKEIGEIPICCVAGNHDYPPQPIPQICNGIYDYPSLQSGLLKQAQKLGYTAEKDISGAYAVQIRSVDVIGLNAASHWRKFVFPKGAQLEWLKHHLDRNSSKWHIILCHAPLWKHNPQRRFGDKEPYLSMDRQLQEIIDTHQRILFLSGHTHISPNIPWGCVEFDSNRKNLYINDGSLCPNELGRNESLIPSEWADGNMIQLDISDREIRITSSLIHSRKKISRGYYVYR